MEAKKTVGKLLTAFLLISIGVGIGKEMAARKIAAPAEPAATAGESKVVVYYMHGIPCVTCTFIESTTETLVREEFADEVSAGRMEFVSLNYLEPENTALADKYEVGSNIVVAVRLEDGREAQHARLDEVMEFASDADSLKDYLRTGIRSVMKGGEE